MAGGRARRAALAAAFALGVARAAAGAGWNATGCVESLSSSSAPGRITFRLAGLGGDGGDRGDRGDEGEPDACRAPAALGIGGEQASKRERYDFGLRQLRDLALALVRGEPVRVGGEGCRAAWIRPALPPATAAAADDTDAEAEAGAPEPCPAPAGYAPAPAPARASEGWQCQSEVAEVLRYEPGRSLQFRLALQPDACVTQRFLEWRGSPESVGTRPSADPDARHANARATLWLLVLAQLDGRLVVVTGRSCEAARLELWSHRLPAGGVGRCVALTGPEPAKRR